jgi:type I restriction enzyme R subunit
MMETTTYFKPNHMPDNPEAFSRVLIDRALEASGWDLLDKRQVRFETHSSSGRADYVLIDTRGKPLCVLEAKKPDIDPYEAKEQARGYAENLGAPFIVLSNGDAHYFWNYQRAELRDAYRIERLPSRIDLERLRLRNMQPPRPLMTDKITADYLKPFNRDIVLRHYQIEAIDTVCREYDEQNRRKFLIEMATGTGKTLLCAALIRRFLITLNAERVLFIVDRIELAKQTMEDFNVILRDFKPVVFKTARRKPAELLGSCVVVATIQSLMTDRRYRTEFTPYHFDLVINDEAHRSIYGDARECVQYFQATRIGLTATPKAYLKNIDIAKLGQENPKALEARFLRDTYHYFGCEIGTPTFRYDLIDAAHDSQGPYLCMPKIFNIRSDITTQALADKGWAVTISEQEESYKIHELERKIFVPHRNRVMCEAFLKHAQKKPDGTLGKSIIFAVNQTHADTITKILNAIQPNLAVTITSRIKGSSEIAKDFRDGKRKEPVAVSVDMLSTGYNCKDLLNVVLMRPVFSPTEYIQIKGRGTRLFTFRIGTTEYKKEYFFLLDFCGVCEYFEDKYDYTMPLEITAVPKEPKKKKDGGSGYGAGFEEAGAGSGVGEESNVAYAIPVWEGQDTVVTEEIFIVGPDGEKVDAMTFRGTFERDVKAFAEKDNGFRKAVNDEDDDAVETILEERFFHNPEMFYSTEKLVQSYGVPAPTPAFAYNALGKKPLPTKDDIVDDTVESIAARFDLRYSDEKWLYATTQLIMDSREDLQKFMRNDMTLFSSSQFNQLGGVSALSRLEHRDEMFEALRQSSFVRQLLPGKAA